MKIKKILPIHAASYYRVLMKELRQDFEANHPHKKQKIVEGTIYRKCVNHGKGKINYKVKILCLKENERYQVQMDFANHAQVLTHHIEQIDEDGVIKVTYEEKVINCSFLMKCLFSLRGRFVRLKVMQFIHYLYQEAQLLEQ